MDELLSERYCKELDGILSCYDRIVITGSLQPFCYAQGMTWYPYQQGIRIFDYAKFAEPLRECVFRSMPTSDSDLMSTTDSEMMSSTESGGCRPPIPVQAVHF